MQKNVVFWWDELLQVCGLSGTTFRVGKRSPVQGETVKMFLEKDLGLSKEEYFRLLRAAGKGSRLQAVMETIAATGIRVGELRFITVRSVDKEDGDLTDQIDIVDNTVDTTKAGLYSVTYKVTDKGGASAEKTINVVVKEKTAPPTTVSQNDSANGTKTGDTMPIGMLAVLMLAAD